MIAGENFARALQTAGERTLVYSDQGVWTGASLNEAVDALASELQARLGVERGATIGMWYWNSIDFLIVLLAIQRAGFCALPADASASTQEANRIFSAVKPVLVLVDEYHELPGTGVDRRYTYANQQLATRNLRPVELDDNVPALMLPRYVDGGHLVAVTLTVGDLRRRLQFNAALHEGSLYGSLAAGATPCFLTVQQMSHGTARIGTLPFLLLGLPQVIMRRFEVDAVLDCLRRHAITTTFMVPGMVERLCANRGSPQSGLVLTRLLYGGAKMSNETVRAAHETLGHCLIRLYGSIEAGWPVAALTREEHVLFTRAGTLAGADIGRAIEDIEIRVGDAQAPTRERIAELFVRSRQVVARYNDADGWYGTGDLVSLDEQGYVRIHGRVDRMINSGAYHVYPQEVEQAIRHAFDTVSVKVYGEPDEKWGEAVVAHIIWGDGVQPPALPEFRRVLSKQIARYKVPRRFYPS